METITLTREELLEFAKMATFHLDDRLCPFSREDLRAESWLIGYLFAKRHQQLAEEVAEETETVFKPMFSIGDTIRLKGSLDEYTIERISEGFYHGKGWSIGIGNEDDYELVSQSQPQSYWKPSDEQMKALNLLLLKGEITEKGQAPCLQSLYNDLKIVYERNN